MGKLIKNKYLFLGVLVMGFLFGFGSTVGQIIGWQVGYLMNWAVG